MCFEGIGKKVLVGVTGFEPVTTGLASRRSHVSTVGSRIQAVDPRPEGSAELHAHWHFSPCIAEPDEENYKISPKYVIPFWLTHNVLCLN